ncbi:hypothetical protein WMY93_034091, partial [Mugilogobius chulae]
ENAVFSMFRRLWCKRAPGPAAVAQTRDHNTRRSVSLCRRRVQPPPRSARCQKNRVKTQNIRVLAQREEGPDQTRPRRSAVTLPGWSASSCGPRRLQVVDRVITKHYEEQQIRLKPRLLLPLLLQVSPRKPRRSARENVSQSVKKPHFCRGLTFARRYEARERRKCGNEARGSGRFTKSQEPGLFPSGAASLKLPQPKEKDLEREWSVYLRVCALRQLRVVSMAVKSTS